MNCPSCHKDVHVADKDVGALFTCPQCRAVYFINFDGTPDYGQVAEPSEAEIKALIEKSLPAKKSKNKDKDKDKSKNLDLDQKLDQQQEQATDSNFDSNNNFELNLQTEPSQPLEQIVATEPLESPFAMPNESEDLSNSFEPISAGDEQQASSHFSESQINPWGAQELSQSSESEINLNSEIEVDNKSALTENSFENSLSSQPHFSPNSSSSLVTSSPLGSMTEANSFAEVAQEIESFGNQPVKISGLSYDLKIIDIENKELKFLVLEALEDSKFGWLNDEFKQQIELGFCELKNLTPLQAFIIARRLMAVEVTLQWTQNVLS